MIRESIESSTLAGRAAAWCAKHPWRVSAAGYLAMALAATFPVVLSPHRQVVGGIRDVWVMLWSNWWFVEAITHYHQSPYFCPLVFYPAGVDMALLEVRVLPGFLFLLTEPLVGLLAAYNLVMLLGLWASGMAMHLLVHYLTRKHVAAFFAGVVFCWSSYMLGTAASGWVHLAHAEWLPLYLWALLRLDDRPSARRGLAAGAMLCLAAHSSWYYGIYLAMYTVLFGAYKLCTGWRDLLRPKFVQGAVAMAVVFLAGTLPAAGPTMVKMAGGDVVPKLRIPDIPAALLDFFVPQRAAAGPRAAYFGYACTYIGYVPLALAVLGAFSGRVRPPRRGFWLLVAGVSFVLALGPTLHVAAGEEFRCFGRPVPLPDAALRKVVPFYRFCRNQWRHHSLFCLALAVLAGCGAASLRERMAAAGSSVWPGLAAVAMLIGMETLWVGPVPFPLPLSQAGIPKLYKAIKERPDDFALIVSPLDYRALYHQTYHHRPIVGYTSRKKRLDPQAEELTRQMLDAAGRVMARTIDGVEYGQHEAIAFLRAQGVGYIIQHLPEEDRVYPIR